jgi:hypothetical protein
MTPVYVHKVFSIVTPISLFVTAGGNDVVEARCSDGKTRVLLTAGKYWNRKEDSQ